MRMPASRSAMAFNSRHTTSSSPGGAENLDYNSHFPTDTNFCNCGSLRFAATSRRASHAYPCWFLLDTDTGNCRKTCPTITHAPPLLHLPSAGGGPWYCFLHHLTACQQHHIRHRILQCCLHERRARQKHRLERRPRQRCLQRPAPRSARDRSPRSLPAAVGARLRPMLPISAKM